MTSALLAALAGCNTTKTEMFSCPNGPEIAVTYADDTATIAFADGRTEALPRDPSREGYFAKPGVAWSETSFRAGRLTDGSSSYACDQSFI